MSLNKVARKIKHQITKIKYPQKRIKKSLHKELAKSIVKEISGFAPYELKAIEMLKRDEDKKCKRFLKKRLGKLGAAKKKLILLNEASKIKK